MSQESQIQPGKLIAPAPELSSRREFLLGAVRLLLATGLAGTALQLWWRSPEPLAHPGPEPVGACLNCPIRQASCPPGRLSSCPLPPGERTIGHE